MVYSVRRRTRRQQIGRLTNFCVPFTFSQEDPEASREEPEFQFNLSSRVIDTRTSGISSDAVAGPTSPPLSLALAPVMVEAESASKVSLPSGAA